VPATGLSQTWPLGGLSLAGRRLPFGEIVGTTTTPASPIDLVRVGIVGVGARGSSHVAELSKVEGVEIRAICDVVESKVAAAQNAIGRAGKPKPEGYSRGQTASSGCVNARTWTWC